MRPERRLKRRNGWGGFRPPHNQTAQSAIHQDFSEEQLISSELD
jgi:hypothetical protein